jgi:NhaP-type Na+/H+ or K+/H+ antiporter
VAFTGMRGIVSLALALALPTTMPNGTPFPQREIVVALSFGVILVTLVLQGLTLPWVIRLLGVKDEGLDLTEERAGLLRATERALARLDELDRDNILPPMLVERLRAPYTERLERLQTEERDDPECLLTEGESAAYRRLRDTLLAAERNQGEISEEVLHRLQEGIDLEALQPDR